MQLPHPPESWKNILVQSFPDGSWRDVMAQIQDRYGSETCYPPAHLLWAALDGLPPDQVRVVILGQDPYHGEHQANGLAFSVPQGQKIPPSLRNIFKEYHHDTGFALPKSGDLNPWKREGVLLLNSSLSVRAGSAGSHRDLPYAPMIQGILKNLASLPGQRAFWLWGNDAQQVGASLPMDRQLILRSAHPSPLGAYRGFFGSKPFSKTNQFFQAQGCEPINWRLEGLPLTL